MTNGMKQHTSKGGEQKRPVETNALTRNQQPAKSKEEFALKTVYTATENNVPIQCLIFKRFKFEFIVTVLVVLICVDDGGM